MLEEIEMREDQEEEMEVGGKGGVQARAHMQKEGKMTEWREA